MKDLKKIFYLSLFFTLIFSNSFGQSVKANLQKSSIFIGDQINFTLEFTGPADLNVVFPALKDSINKYIEIVQKTEIKSELSSDKKQKTLIQVFTITSFDSGYFAIKPFRFYYSLGKDTSRLFSETQPLMLFVQPLKVDLQKGIRDIKPPLEAKFTFREALPYLIALLIIIAITIFIVYYLKKRKRNEPIFKLPPKPKLPPHEIAMAALEQLRNKKLWQNNKIKEFHTELTEIIRQYLEDRFGIPALEMISDEIVDSINRLDIDNKIKEELKELLNLADLVKFAKENPLPSEHDRSFNNAIDIVRSTIILITNS